MKLNIGDNYFVRTEGDHWVGRLVSIDGPSTVTLVDLAWVAVSGRLHAFVRDGRADNMEIEPYPDGREQMINFRAITPWPFPLLREVV